MNGRWMGPYFRALYLGIVIGMTLPPADPWYGIWRWALLVGGVFFAGLGGWIVLEGADP